MTTWISGVRATGFSQNRRSGAELPEQVRGKEEQHLV